MDEDILTKIFLLLPWLITLVVGFVIGIPLFHAVSTLDTALFQAGEIAKTGSDTNVVKSAISQLVTSGLPQQMNDTTLFNPTTDVTVTPNASGSEETVTIVYHDPIFAPFVSMFGWSGPTLPLHFTKTVNISSADNKGVPYSQ